MYELEPRYSPERTLLQSVLLLAVHEALRGINENKSFEAKVHAIEHTRVYLTRPSADLAFVCAGAGIDMRAAIERMTERMANEPKAIGMANGKRRVNLLNGSLST